MPARYYLVVDRPLGRPVHVLVACPPRFRAAPVLLHRLNPPALRPAVGRSRINPGVYAEFPSADAAARAGFVLVAAARVCNSWDEYLEPWHVPYADPAAADAAARTARMAAPPAPAPVPAG